MITQIFKNKPITNYESVFYWLKMGVEKCLGKYSGVKYKVICTKGKIIVKDFTRCWKTKFLKRVTTFYCYIKWSLKSKIWLFHVFQDLFNFSRVKQRSIITAAAKYKKDNTKKIKRYCMFFNRFGKCQRQDKCPYVHDPERVAVCTR